MSFRGASSGLGPVIPRSLVPGRATRNPPAPAPRLRIPRDPSASKSLGMTGVGRCPRRPATAGLNSAEVRRTMDKLETAVIGYGKVAHIHAEALASIPESEFVAVCGRDAGKARAFAEQYRVKAFTSVEEMVGAGVQAVVVATPHPAHASVTIRRPAGRGPRDRREAARLVPRGLRRDDRRRPRGREDAGHDQPATALRAGPARAAGDRRRQARPARARHRHLARLARRGVLPQRPLAGQLGRRGRGRPRQPGPAPDRHPAVVHGGGRRALRGVGEPQPPLPSRSRTPRSPSSASRAARSATSS